MVITAGNDGIDQPELLDAAGKRIQLGVRHALWVERVGTQMIKAYVVDCKLHSKTAPHQILSSG